MLLRSQILTAVTFLILGWGLSIVITLSSVPSDLEAQVNSHDSKVDVHDLSREFQNVSRTIRPSVVSISLTNRIKSKAQQPRNPFQNLPKEFRGFFDDDRFEKFFEFRIPDRGYKRHALGTGVIISRDGYLLTNSHVVRGADEVRVTLHNNQEFEAEVIGTDKKSDLAVLKINAKGLTPAELGDSDKIAVGEWVLAVGSPFGLEQTVTAGIVSAKGRANVGVADYEDFIQTDAAINPGNSGGPLVSLDGKVIGINTAIASRSGGYMGIGFAIPSQMVKGVMDAIMKHGHVERGRLGAFVRDLTKDLGKTFGFVDDKGVLVEDVTPDSSADKAGLKSGDIIVKFNGKSMKSANQLRNTVAMSIPGKMIEMVIFRDGKLQTLNVKIGQLPRDEIVASLDEKSVSLGMTLQTLTPEIARQLNLDENQKGAIVSEVEPGSLADRAGIRPKDVIIAVGSKPINELSTFQNEMKSQDLKRGIRIQVLREGIRRFVFIQSSR